MKKVGILLLCLFFISGCNSKEEMKTLKCSYSSEDSTNGYKITADYQMYYVDDIVDSVKTIETIESDNTAILTTFKNTLDSTYEEMNTTYGGYDYNVEINGNILTSTTKIDYNKMDILKYAEDNPSLEDYLKNGKLTVEGLKAIYAALGATCN